MTFQALGPRVNDPHLEYTHPRSIYLMKFFISFLSFDISSSLVCLPHEKNQNSFAKISYLALFGPLLALNGLSPKYGPLSYVRSNPAREISLQYFSPYLIFFEKCIDLSYNLNVVPISRKLLKIDIYIYINCPLHKNDLENTLFQLDIKRKISKYFFSNFNI